MEIVFIVQRQATTLVNDLKELLVVEGFKGVRVRVDLPIGRAIVVVADLNKGT